MSINTDRVQAEVDSRVNAFLSDLNQLVTVTTEGRKEARKSPETYTSVPLDERELIDTFSKIAELEYMKCISEYLFSIPSEVVEYEHCDARVITKAANLLYPIVKSRAGISYSLDTTTDGEPCLVRDVEARPDTENEGLFLLSSLGALTNMRTDPRCLDMDFFSRPESSIEMFNWLGIKMAIARIPDQSSGAILGRRDQVIFSHGDVHFNLNNGIVSVDCGVEVMLPGTIIKLKEIIS